ncbi:MAG: hypothetical protein RLZZ203_172, partial [Cyanobacteriota bacterium]
EINTKVDTTKPLQSVELASID